MLEKTSVENFSSDSDGLDLNRQTITGDNEVYFKAVMEMIEGRHLTDEEYFPKYVKAHIDKQIIMYRGLMAKFTQNVELREELISTGNAVLVEASPKDRVWGIALFADDPDAFDMNKWKGENLLGFALMAVRNELK